MLTHCDEKLKIQLLNKYIEAYRERVETYKDKKIENLSNMYAGLVDRLIKIKQGKQTIIFGEKLLSKIHELFNSSDIWEQCELSDFLKAFKREYQLKIKQRGNFCFLLGCIEDVRSKENCPNMNDWVKDIFEINDYKRQKHNSAKVDSKAYNYKSEIERKINSI